MPAPPPNLAETYPGETRDLQGLFATLGAEPAKALLPMVGRRAIADRTIEVAPPLDPALADAMKARIAAAQAALARLAAQSGDPAFAFTAEERAALDAVTLLVHRPALFTRAGRPVRPPKPMWKELEEAGELVEPNVRAVGALVRGGKVDGTAWRVGEDLLLTNNHVVAQATGFAEAQGGLESWYRKPAEYAAAVKAANGRWKKKAEATFELGRELEAPEAVVTDIVEVVAHHPEHDVAVLRVDGPLPDDVAPIELDWDTSAPPASPVYVVGYPVVVPSNSTPAFLIESVFAAGTKRGLDEVLSTRRLSPGRVLRAAADLAKAADAATAKALTSVPYAGAWIHDAATLGGSSGSAVFSLEDHRAVAIHFGGSYGLRINVAVPFFRVKDWLREQLAKAGG